MDLPERIFKEVEIQCKECIIYFKWTPGEQAFLADLKADGKIPEVIAPKRCPECRVKYKARMVERERQENMVGIDNAIDNLGETL